MMEQSQNTPQKQKPGQLLLDVALSVILPTLVLKYLSAEDSLGPALGLVVALSFPFSLGIYRFILERKFGLIPILGFVSILLTGGIGLLELDPKYIAIKEAAIPLAIGLFTIVSLKTRYPLVKTFIYNDMILQTEKVAHALEVNNSSEAFESKLQTATFILAGSFFLSAILNYGLAKYIVTSPAGTPAFNDELGTMNLLSYPVITIPCLIVMMYAMFYLFREIKKLTGLTLEDIIKQ